MRNFKILAAIILPVVLIFGAGSIPAAAQNMNAAQTEAVHEELRALLKRSVSAMEQKNPEALMAELSDDVVFTAMNNELVDGKAAALQYYQRMMDGSSSIVEDLELTVVPDIKSKLHNNGESAIAVGTSMATLKLRGGIEFTAPLRWSAGLVRDGKDWKIASLHYSGNIFENPIDTGLRKYLWLMLGGAGIIGLIIGFLMGRRRRRV